MPSNFSVLDWLNQFLVNSRLDEEVVKPVLDFVLMWNLFESSAFQKRASVQKIRDVARYLHEDGLIRRDDITVFLNYFVDRYFLDSQGSYHFPYLKFRNARDHQFVERVLLSPDESQEDEVLAAMLMIVYRYRNNLFHGEKWIYGLHSQVVNFSMANELVAWVLDSLNQAAVSTDERLAEVYDPVLRIKKYIKAKINRT